MIKNLFIRMDKIGDLVLSLNADQWAPVKDESNHWWVSKGLEFIPELAQPQRACTSFSKNFSVGEFSSCLRWLKQHKPERAFVFHAPWWVGFALLLAGVPYRVGRRSQWHSFLSFNFGVRQSRSQADRHESQYNIDLMSAALKKIEPQSSLEPTLPAPLELSSPSQQRVLKDWRLEGVSYVVVHPGMAGSALNWPTSCYIDLIRSLSASHKVVLTGSSMDRPYLDPIKQELKNQPNLLWLDEKLNLKELLIILNSAKAVVAPSTGVIHLAAALGTPCVGIYSPRRVERPLRWGPRGKSVTTFVPEGLDPDTPWDISVMEKISPVKVEEKIKQIVSGTQAE